jgi:hypothetical protein
MNKLHLNKFSHRNLLQSHLQSDKNGSHQLYKGKKRKKERKKEKHICITCNYFSQEIFNVKKMSNNVLPKKEDQYWFVPIL